MPKTVGNLWAVLRQCGVEILAAQSTTKPKARQTRARATLRRVLDAGGEDHLARVLVAICGDAKGRRRNREGGNAACLDSATIEAVSTLFMARPDLVDGDAGMVFDTVDLAALRRVAKSLGNNVSVSLCALLAAQLLREEAAA